ncbi:MAG: 4-alpha-glucanotransferase, partial [Pseudomonadota bacterium]
MHTPRIPTLADRTAGILLHPTSLSGGDLGPGAHEMVEFLAAAGQSWWQTLPINPPGYGNSPYSAESAFAGNPALVSTDSLIADGLLGVGDRSRAQEKRLRAAFRAFAGGDPDYQQFVAGASDWLEDFALYRALKHRHGGGVWTEWAPELRGRDPAALDRAREELANEMAV